MSNKPYSKHRYTAAQKEILCNLDVGSNENAKKWQNKLAGKLADQIENDVENTLYNPNKINKYREKAGLPPIEAEPSLITSENALTALSWFTSFRLFIVRINGALGAAGLGFLPKWFDILGFSYIFELIIKLGDLGYTTFGPLRQREQYLIDSNQATRGQIYRWRFKNKIFQDEELIPCILNAVVWVSLNVASFVMTGGISGLATTAGHAAAAAAIKRVVTYMNIGGFIFDFVLEGVKGLKDYWQHSQALIEVTKDVKHLTEKRKVLTDGYTLVLMSSLPENNRKKAEPGKIYLSENGKYIVRGLDGKVHTGLLDTREIDCQNLTTKLNDNEFKQKILKVTNLFGHTEHTKRDLEDAGKTNSKEYRKVCEKITKTESKLESRQVFKTELDKKITWSIIPVRIYNWAMTGLVGIGMSFLAGIDKAGILAGRCMSLIFGSVFNGLGRRLYNKIKEEINWLSALKENESINHNISINNSDARAMPVPAQDNTDNTVFQPTAAIDIRRHDTKSIVRKLQNSLPVSQDNYAPQDDSVTKNLAYSYALDATPRNSSVHESKSHENKITTQYNSNTNDSPLETQPLIESNPISDTNNIENNSEAFSFSW